jgi:hypothetical protein
VGDGLDFFDDFFDVFIDVVFEAFVNKLKPAKSGFGGRTSFDTSIKYMLSTGFIDSSSSVQ